MSHNANQYSDSSKLAARINLHIKYGRRAAGWDLPNILKFAKGEHVLDIGCGPARVWIAAKATLPTDLVITLADSSLGMINEALTNLRSLGDATRGCVADVCALPFERDSFDAVLAMHMLYHAADVASAVDELARVLKPAGRLFATTNGQDSMCELQAICDQVFEPHEFGISAFTLESGEKALQRRFDHVEVKRFADVLHITDPEDVVRYLTSFPPGDGASPKKISELRQNVDHIFHDHGGALNVTRIAGYLLVKT